MNLGKKEKLWLWIGVGLVAAYVVYKGIKAGESVISALNPVNWFKKAASAASAAGTAIAATASNAATGAAVVADGGIDNYVQQNTVPALNADGSAVTPDQAAAAAQAANDNTSIYVNGVAYDNNGNPVSGN